MPPPPPIWTTHKQAVLVCTLVRVLITISTSGARGRVLRVRSKMEACVDTLLEMGFFCVDLFTNRSLLHPIDIQIGLI